MGNKYISEEIMERDMERKKEWERSRMNERNKEKERKSLSITFPKLPNRMKLVWLYKTFVHGQPGGFPKE